MAIIATNYTFILGVDLLIQVCLCISVLHYNEHTTLFKVVFFLVNITYKKNNKTVFTCLYLFQFCNLVLFWRCNFWTNNQIKPVRQVNKLRSVWLSRIALKTREFNDNCYPFQTTIEVGLFLREDGVGRTRQQCKKDNYCINICCGIN